MANKYHEVKEMTPPTYDIGGGRVCVHLSDDNTRIVMDHTIGAHSLMFQYGLKDVIAIRDLLNEVIPLMKEVV